MARSMPPNVWVRSTSAGSTVSVPGASETSSKPYVGRIVSTFEWKTRRWAARAEVRLRSVDHVALLCRLTVGCLLHGQSTRGAGGRDHRGYAPALEVELEPGARAGSARSSRIRSIDSRYAGQIDARCAAVRARPSSRRVVLVGQDRLRVRRDPDGEDGAGDDPVHRRLVELVPRSRS